MGTAFIVERPTDPSLAVVPQLPASIYYTLPRAAIQLFGSSEVTYRLPSILLMAIALFVIARLAARLVHPGAGWFAVFACVAMEDFNYYAVDARPYALGICVTCLALYFLIVWLDAGRWMHALLFVLFAALLWKVQLVFWAFYPVFAIYTIIRLIRRDTPVRWRAAIGISAVLSAALIPVALEALHVLDGAKAHSYAPIPAIRGLPISLYLPIAAAAAAGIWLLAQFNKWPLQPGRSAATLSLVALWWLWMPLCLFFYSRYTGNVLFLPRYFSLVLPGVALTVAAIVGLYLPAAQWRRAAVIAGLAALAIAGHWSRLAFDHTLEDWRHASSEADFEAEEPDTPVLAVSPYVEAQPPVWNSAYALPGFLYAPLFVYPIRGKVYPFPFIRSAEADAYAGKLVAETLSRRHRFIVYGAGRNCYPWLLWLSQRPELASWRSRVEPGHVVEVVIFENPAEGTLQFSGHP